MITLKDIAEFSSGIYKQPEKWADIIQLHARHFNDDGSLKDQPFPELTYIEPLKKHLLTDGDILVTARGFRNFAAIYRSSIGAAVASSTFIIIKLKPEIRSTILPEYVKWYLNQPDSINYMRNQNHASSVTSINIALLKDVQIPIPPVNIQNMVLRIDELSRKKMEIIQQIEEQEAMLTRGILKNLITQKTRI